MGEYSGGLCGCAVGPEGEKKPMVPVIFVVSYHPLEHIFNDFVDSLYFPISLRVVG